MNQIITLTVNPAIDKSTTIEELRPGSKLRCSHPEYDAGGGGINVSRVIRKLGGDSLCIFLAGGPTGMHLHQLLDRDKIKHRMLPIGDWTRESFSVLDRASNLQYRFVLPGPTLLRREWQKVLEVLTASMHKGDFVVASGSLPPRIPDDFYARVARAARRKGARLILDTSGKPLVLGAKAGVFMLKPNLHELALLCNTDSIPLGELEAVAVKFYKKGTCDVLVVSLGARGGLLVTRDLIEHISAPSVHQESTIGAGDSMVGGMTLALKEGKSMGDVVRFGIACGTATTMNPGTQLCKKKDAVQLFNLLKMNR